VHLELEPEAPNLSLTPTFLRGCSLPLFGTHIIFACPISCLADLELPPVLHFGSGGRETESKRWGPTLGHASLLAKPSIEIASAQCRAPQATASLARSLDRGSGPSARSAWSDQARRGALPRG
jgi:hypothetical protein